MHRNRLMQLFRDNAKAEAKQPFRSEANGGEATLYVYDVIVSDDFWGGVAAEAFVKALDSLDASTVHIRINSPGGDVFAARAMEAAIRGCGKKTVAHIDGYAASAASYVALACDEVEIAPGAMFMIHCAWTIEAGDAEDFLKTAVLLEKIDASLVDTYATETGQKPEDLKAMMDAETWISAQEAVDLGFADRIAADAPKACKAWNLTAYMKPPEQETQGAPLEPEPAQAASCEHDHIKRRLALCEALGRRVPARP